MGRGKHGGIGGRGEGRGGELGGCGWGWLDRGHNRIIRSNCSTSKSVLRHQFNKIRSN